MRRMLEILAVTMLLAQESAVAAPLDTYFYTQGRRHHARFDPELAAVPLNLVASESLAASPFARLGVALVPLNDARAHAPVGKDLGAPLWLDDGGAIGVVTRRALIGADAVPAVPAALSVTLAPFGQGVYIATFASPAEALTGAAALSGRPGIRWAHPDFLFEVEARSAAEHTADPRDEPLFSAQWNLTTIGAPQAWSKTTGDAGTLVAVIDLGFEQSHPDLKDAWFVNPGEIPGNHVDDDHDGYIDDVSGWNFAINGTNLIYGQNPAHGTCTSGLVGARANGQGVTGICPGCTVLPLVIDDDVANAAAAFDYARKMGAAVISNSWGYRVGTPTTDAVVEAIDQATRQGRGGKGTTVVFAMGNYHKDDCRGPEPDISSLASVVAVSSVDFTGKKVDASGFGACLEFVSPSSGSEEHGVPSTDRPGVKGYNTGARATDFPDLDYTNTFYGTSAAAPQVAASFALLYSRAPDLTSDRALQLMIDSADKVSPTDAQYDSATGRSLLYGFGRINVGEAMSRL